MKEISIQYFAMLREKSGKSQEEYKTLSNTYSELYTELNDLYQFDLPLSIIQIAVNDEYSNLEAPIKDGDRIVFIPPVAGG